MLTVVQFNV